METKVKRAQRVRSPNYPNYDLKQCMIFLQKLYNKYGTSEVHIEDAITQMGHSPTSSTAARVIASMFSFGLIESRGSRDNKFIRLSRLAQEILLEDEDSLRRFELLQQAAIKDNSMQDIWEKWGKEIPAEETIKKSLQLEMNYSPEGAKRFASVIVETYNYAHLNQISSSDEYPQGKGGTEEEIENKNDTGTSSTIRKANLLLRGVNREIRIYAPIDLDEAEFDLLFKWLELQKYGLVSQDKINE